MRDWHSGKKRTRLDKKEMKRVYGTSAAFRRLWRASDARREKSPGYHSTEIRLLKKDEALSRSSQIRQALQALLKFFAPVFCLLFVPGVALLSARRLTSSYLGD
jgi:hypothetical protein